MSESDCWQLENIITKWENAGTMIMKRTKKKGNLWYWTEICNFD